MAPQTRACIHADEIQASFSQRYAPAAWEAVSEACRCEVDADASVVGRGLGIEAAGLAAAEAAVFPAASDGTAVCESTAGRGIFPSLHLGSAVQKGQ